ncbi:hypothetical protein ABZ464_51205 [Streptomyces sp. NPDC005820]|uniref:hypothetical protein n=1 Tax=Streptomyces sp. NPDC005820 TaxID=3157069 RepID=UPI0033C18F85
MVSVTDTARNIEITAESLEADLARLQIQKQALERELAAVVAHLGSVQRALGALETVMSAPAAAAPPTTAPPSDHGREQSRGRARAAASAEPRKTVAAAKSANVTTATDAPQKYGKLTEQIMGYFAEVGDADVRARDVAAALGRDTDSGSINAVRSTLDRLVGMSRLQRAGRGLYRARRS